MRAAPMGSRRDLHGAIVLLAIARAAGALGAEGEQSPAPPEQPAQTERQPAPSLESSAPVPGADPLSRREERLREHIDFVATEARTTRTTGAATVITFGVGMAV